MEVSGKGSPGTQETYRPDNIQGQVEASLGCALAKDSLSKGGCRGRGLEDLGQPPQFGTEAAFDVIGAFLFRKMGITQSTGLIFASVPGTKTRLHHLN